MQTKSNIEEESSTWCEYCNKHHIVYTPNECPKEPEYIWPYSNKCPDCFERAMVNNICTNCGADYSPVICKKCGSSYSNQWDKKGGCPVCQGFC